ncbi:hypothetical protein AAG570_007603 [Ranatra chinensis]|uniref:Uncharacterized protein n=1 Tax=Ranatra chinensis TaxID=642074 RepID=A0ABD0YFT7_9HEMI
MKMASKRRNMFYQNKKQETTEIVPNIFLGLNDDEHIWWVEGMLTADRRRMLTLDHSEHLVPEGWYPGVNMKSAVIILSLLLMAQWAISGQVIFEIKRSLTIEELNKMLAQMFTPEEDTPEPEVEHSTERNNIEIITEQPNFDFIVPHRFSLKKYRKKKD